MSHFLINQSQIGEVCLDWRTICRVMLKHSFTVNPLTTQPNELGHQGHNLTLSLEFVSGKISSEAQLTQKYPQEQFFEQILHRRRLAIIGASGTGKTTLLCKIADWVLKETEDIPIWISLAEMGNKPLAQYLQENWLAKAAKVQNQPLVTLKQAFEQLLNSGQVWLLLDDVNEMAIASALFPNPQDNHSHLLNPLSTLAQQIQSWTDKSRVILTCRQDVWEADPHALSPFDIYRTLAFTDSEQVRQVINSWFTSAPFPLTQEQPKKGLGEQLWQTLNQPGRESFQELVTNPLRLALLCRLWPQNSEKLPDTEAQLTEKLVTAFYEWKAEQVVTTLEQQQQLNQVLGRLAVQALQAESDSFPLSERLISEILLEDVSLFPLALQLKWLTCVGRVPEKPDEKVYAFCDPRFQEYFAALALKDWHFFFNQKNSLIPVFESRWKRVILLWLGRGDINKEEKEAFLNALIAFEDGCSQDNFYGKRAYFLAAAGIAEFADYSRAEEVVTQILQWSFSKAETVLTQVAQAAKATLKETNRSKAIAALIQLLKSNSNPELRQAFNSLESLALENQYAIASLEQFLATAQSEQMLWQVADCLGKINPGNRSVIATLIDLYETTTKAEIRKLALNSLERVGQGNQKAITALIKRFHSTEPIPKRVFQSLEKIGHGNAMASATLIQLIRATKEESIQRQAAESLEKIDPGNPTAIAVLVQLSQKAKHEEIRRQAIYSLGEITPGNLDAIAALVQRLNASEDLLIRWLALSSLSRIGEGNLEAIAPIIQLLQSPEQVQLHKDAIESLEKIAPDHPAIITALIRLLQSTDDESIQIEIAESLGKIDPGNPEAITTLVQLFQTSSDPFTHRQAADCLGKIDPGNLEALTVLIKLIQSNTDQDLISLAAESLGDIGTAHPTAIATLIHLLQSSDNPDILSPAIKSLGKIGNGNQEAITILIRLLQSTADPANCLQATDSLMLSLTKKQIRPAITALRDSVLNHLEENDLAYRKVIWYCTQQLSYPEFYQAWHQSCLTTHSLIAKDKTFQLNQNIRLIWIDSSQFIDPDHPLVDIYDQMLAQNCPEFAHGIPETIAKLRLYWNTLRRNHPESTFVLIFYAKESNTLNLPATFLETLSKFEGAVCVVSEYFIKKLQYFSPRQPQLVEAILEWVEEKDEE